jgi:hypothetical protein
MKCGTLGCGNEALSEDSFCQACQDDIAQYEREKAARHNPYFWSRCDCELCRNGEKVTWF